MTPTPSRKGFAPINGDELADPNYFLYFAYGSNLLTERIHVSNPSAEFVGVGVLAGYSLGFLGTSTNRWKGAGATIRRNDTPGSRVYGVVWRMHADHSESLDHQESAYARLTVDVQVQLFDQPMTTTTSLACRTYQQQRSAGPFPDLPSPHYKWVIVCGAEEHGLPRDYVEFLKSLPDNGYAGSVEYQLRVLTELNKDAPT